MSFCRPSSLINALVFLAAFFACAEGFSAPSLTFGNFTSDPETGRTKITLESIDVSNVAFKASLDGAEIFNTFIGDSGNWRMDNFDLLTDVSAATFAPGFHTVTATATATFIGLGNVVGHISTSTWKRIYLPPPAPASVPVGPASADQARLALDADGRAHVAYPGPQFLHYAICAAGQCGTSPVALEKTAGPLSFAVDNAGNPHILYYNPGLGQLKYATRSKTSWTIETVANGIDRAWVDAFGADLGVDAAARAHVCYFDGDSLMYARRGAAGWSSTQLVKLISPGAVPCAIALSAAGKPVIVYGDGKALTVGSVSGGAWVPHAKTADGAYGGFSGRLFVRVGAEDLPRVMAVGTGAFWRSLAPAGELLHIMGEARSDSNFSADNFRLSHQLDLNGNQHLIAMYANYGAMGHFLLDGGADLNLRSFSEKILDQISPDATGGAAEIDVSGRLHAAVRIGASGNLVYIQKNLAPARGAGGAGLKLALASGRQQPLAWSWNEAPAGALGFRLYGGDTAEGPFQVIAGTETLGPGARGYAEPGPPPAGYVRYLAAVMPGGDVLSNTFAGGIAITPSAPDPDAPLAKGFSFPNPAPAGVNPTIHVETGVADSVDARIYTLAGDFVSRLDLAASPAVIVDNVYAYETIWDVSSVAPGIYRCVVTAQRADQKQTLKFNLAVVK